MNPITRARNIPIQVNLEKQKQMQMENKKYVSHKKAEPFIQSHINWCWATCAKIVGIQYCHLNSRPLLFSQQIRDIPRNDLRGLRLSVCGTREGAITVDALQMLIVEHARSPEKNLSGNFPEDDNAKERALRYVITGSIHSKSPDIIVAGDYYNQASLLDVLPDELDAAIGLSNPFIANYRRVDETFHSVVLSPISETRLRLYDPWDGYQEEFSKLQLFKSGFLTNQGPGIIQWIQYIRSENRAEKTR